MDNKKQAIQEAYQFMELSPPYCEWEQVKKQYKKLSLRHHPDRNGGSQESHNKMQQLNACFGLIARDLLRNKGRSIHSGDTKEEGEDISDLDDDSHSDEGNNEGNNNDNDNDNYYEQMQQEMEEEMERYRQRRREFQQHKQQDAVQAHRKQKELGLQTEEGRKAAHESFCQQVRQKKKMDDNQPDHTAGTNQKDPFKKDDNQPKHSSNANTKPPPNGPSSKPKNMIMEYNVDEIVTALRLGLPDIALGLLEENINTYIQRRARDAQQIFIATGERITFQSLGREYLMRHMDFDNNALLHYSVYFECYQVVNAICGIAQHKFHCLPDVILQSNVYQQSPWTFAVIAQDDSIRALVQSQLDLVHQWRVQSQVIPAICDALRRVKEIGKNINLVETFSTILSFLIMTHNKLVFELHPMAALLGIAFGQYGRESLLLSQRNIRGNHQYEGHKLRTLPKHEQGILDVSMLLTFGCLWKGIPLVMEYLSRHIKLKVLLVTIISMTGIASWCSRERPLADRLLLPVSFAAVIAGYLAQLLVLLLASTCRLQVRVSPTSMRTKTDGNSPLVKPFLLILGAVMALGTKHVFNKLQNWEST